MLDHNRVLAAEPLRGGEPRRDVAPRRRVRRRVRRRAVAQSAQGIFLRRDSAEGVVRLRARLRLRLLERVVVPRVPEPARLKRERADHHRGELPQRRRALRRGQREEPARGVPGEHGLKRGVRIVPRGGVGRVAQQRLQPGGDEDVLERARVQPIQQEALGAAGDGRGVHHRVRHLALERARARLARAAGLGGGVRAQRARRLDVHLHLQRLQRRVPRRGELRGAVRHQIVRVHLRQALRLHVQRRHRGRYIVARLAAQPQRLRGRGAHVRVHHRGTRACVWNPKAGFLSRHAFARLPKAGGVGTRKTRPIAKRQTSLQQM